MQSTALLQQCRGCRHLGQNRKAGERLTMGESDGGRDGTLYTNQEGKRIIWKVRVKEEMSE